jgi:aspartate aminotransferase
MSSLSQLAESLIGSEIVKLGNEISKRVQQGEKIYNYTIGDFDPDIFPIPARLEELIIECYRQKFTNYPPADGLLELRTAVSGFMEHYGSVSYSPNEVLIASGGRPLIYAIFKTIVDKDDKVIYAVPSWNNNHYVAMNHGVHCTIDTFPENNFMPTVADIKQHISGAAMLCLCTPQNPTGTTIGREAMEGICDLVLEENSKRTGTAKKLYVMFDQMYSLLTYGDIKHYSPAMLRPAMKDYTICVDGISKSFAIGAWAPMAEQKATARFLVQQGVIDEYFAHFRSELQDRLLTIYKGFVHMKEKGLNVDCITPQAAMYLTIKLDLKGMYANGKQLHDQKDVTEYILNEAKLAIVPFTAFGGAKTSPWYRMSIGTCLKPEIPVMLAQLEAAIQKLQ